MSFASLLNRPLAIERPYQTLDIDDFAEYDDLNQPIREYVSVTEDAKGRISSGIPREVDSVHQAGPVIADHIIFLLPTVDITTADRIHDTSTGRVFEVLGRQLIDGASAQHHWQVFAREITSPTPLVEAEVGS